MHHFSDSLFFTTVFKFFNFRRSERQIRRVFYRNAIYEGEVSSDHFSSSLFISNGIGTLITNQATCVYGSFKNGELFGEANVFLNDGGFLRGPFEDGIANGQFVYVTFTGDIYLMNLENGVLSGHVTFMPQSRPIVFILNFVRNRLTNVLHSYDFPTDVYYKSKIQILREFLEKSQMNECLLSERDITTQLKRIESVQRFVGSYEIGNKQFMYNGMFDSKLNFCGLGFLFKEDGRVEIGNFEETKLNHIGVIFDRNYMYFGLVDKGELNGKVIVKSLSKNAYKTCFYEKGRFDKVDSQGTGMPHDPLFQFTAENYSSQFGSAQLSDHCSNQKYIIFNDEEFCLDIFDEFIQRLPDSTCTKSEQQDSLKQLLSHKPANVIKGIDQKFTFRAKSREAIFIPKQKSSLRSQSEAGFISLLRPATASNIRFNPSSKTKTPITSSQRFIHVKNRPMTKIDNTKISLQRKAKTKTDLEETKKMAFSSTKGLFIKKLKLNNQMVTKKLSLQNNTSRRFINKMALRKPSGSENNFLGNRSTNRTHSNLISFS